MHKFKQIPLVPLQLLFLIAIVFRICVKPRRSTHVGRPLFQLGLEGLVESVFSTGLQGSASSGFVPDRLLRWYCYVRKPSGFLLVFF